MGRSSRHSSTGGSPDLPATWRPLNWPGRISGSWPKFGIDRYSVQSWHAGIHPGCEVAGAVCDNYERWSGAAFVNPRLLHFHTCGAYAPGAISWNVVDPMIIVDGIAVWKDGALHPELVPGGAEILDRFPDAKAIFGAPNWNTGLCHCRLRSATATPAGHLRNPKKGPTHDL